MCEAAGITLRLHPGGTVRLSSEQHNTHWHQEREASPSALAIKERKTSTWAWLGGFRGESVSADFVEWQDLNRFGGEHAQEAKWYTGGKNTRNVQNTWCRKVLGLESDSPALQIFMEATQGTEVRAEADRNSVRSSGECGKLVKMGPEERCKEYSIPAHCNLFEMCSVLQYSPSFQEKLKIQLFSVKISQFFKVG